VCGIIGILDLRTPVSDRRLAAGLREITHRGPDGEGAWFRTPDGKPFVGLGHRRLSILDLSPAGAQPMGIRSPECWVTYNGEIYNYVELREELIQEGCRFISSTDTEVLLSAYGVWGVDCLKKFNGMFAFALWDEKMQTLILARDRFGEKPLFYAINQECTQIVFASEMKALFATGLVPCAYNEGSLFRYVAWRELEGNQESIYDGVSRVMPGEYIQVSTDGVKLDLRVKKYWEIDPLAVRNLSLEVAAQEFAEIFRDSVRLRLRSDVPIGTCLSGGLDSSSVVRQILDLNLSSKQRTFSARMPDPRLDEGQHINAVLEGTNIEAFDVWVDQDSLREVFGKLCYHQEEPFTSTNMFAQYQVMGLASSHATTVLLDGQGADELVTGYQWYVPLHCFDLARKWSFVRLFRELCGLRQKQGKRGWISLRLLLKGIFGSMPYRPLDYALSSTDYRSWWAEDWIKQHETSDSRTHQTAPYRDALTWRLYHDCFGGQLQDLLRYGDRNSMAWSRELRQPFLDHRLAELAFSLPSMHKILDGESKVILRRAMKPILPKHTFERQDKVGFQTPLAAWMFDENRADWIEAKLLQAKQILGSRIVEKPIDHMLANRNKRSEWGHARYQFNVLTMGETYQQMQAVAHKANFLDRGNTDMTLPPVHGHASPTQ
jgi:asparagine synthase (glutamine-hydrolysing)